MTERDFLHDISATLLLDTMAEGVILVDTEGRIRVWNKAMTEITGYDAEEALNRTTEWLRSAECMGAEKIFALFNNAKTQAKPALTVVNAKLSQKAARRFRSWLTPESCATNKAELLAYCSRLPIFGQYQACVRK